MHKSPWSKFLENLIYGFVLCARIRLPWMVREGVIARLPFASDLDNLIDRLGVPRSLTRLVLAVPTLVLLG